ncbi:MAG: VOC family protein [Promethearchaeota archaeon]
MEENYNFNLGKLKINQLGYLYKNIEKQIKIMESLYGCPKFAIFENKDNIFKYRGNDSKITTRIAISRLFNTQIELIQLIEGECIFKEFMDSGREGLHHFGIFVEDLEPYIKEFKKKGIDVVHAGQTGKQKVAYLDTEKTFGVYLEFQQTIKRKKKKS